MVALPTPKRSKPVVADVPPLEKPTPPDPRRAVIAEIVAEARRKPQQYVEDARAKDDGD